MKLQHIGKVPIQKRYPYLILEAGVNHGGDFECAADMVDAAADLGVPMIKFQSYKADSLAIRRSPAYWDQSEESTASQFELFSKFDRLDINDYVRLADRCYERGIEFCTTAFDRTFVEALAPYLKVFKVASADLTNLPLLRQIGAYGKPVILSTGASEIHEIHRAVEQLEESGVSEVALLHCVLEYPTQPKNANLLSIPALQREFPRCSIGWSDHVKVAYDSASVIAAWLLGATLIEKHFTLDKTLSGNDHYHALDVADVKALQAQLTYYSELLGTKEKKSLPCEAAARMQARRSLVAGVAIPEGTVIRPEMLVPKRPGTGIPPDCIDELIGQVATRSIEQDEQISWDMVRVQNEVIAAV